MEQPSTADAGRLSYAIFALARAHRGFAAALLRDLGLHPGQELLLMRLFDRDGQTQSELLDHVGLDHSTVSKSLRRMQEAGLLTREPSERDRRVLHVWLTDKGRAMREPLTALWSTLERASVRNLAPGEADTFIRLAGVVEDAIAHRHTYSNEETPR
ncbi:MarR family winged helix-turn-helix transcriptional regulator [Saccharothrix sp. NRRL B-16314]|uniref:MarR family winged helix-turn-helix transcriptional regulator n=1 Tax=Saccharothrix sp. NRRL B-16314 TaxID=1463825 RepID=UPI000A63C30C|nr:MarR family transcriptional regulator [Saccharothrix sp. NRRL B-16314]